MDSSGNLYGTTTGGGTSSDKVGTVFELVKGSSTITTLASFDGSDGSVPAAGLLMDSSGNLYGTTEFGGPGYSKGKPDSGLGTVFELPKGSGTITMLASFDGNNGSLPQGSLIMDRSGDLLGTASAGGGANKYGTVFGLAQGSGTITALASFDGNGSDGLVPLCSLLLDSNNNLYGTASGGGSADNGTIFEVQGGVPVPPPADQWTGANFAHDTNWSDGQNWSLGAPPTAGQMALFTKNSSVKSFTSTVDAGFTNPIDWVETDNSWGGTINVNSSLTVTGNFVMASGTFGGNGAVSIAGPYNQWTGGTIDVGSGGFTNTGTLTADTSGGNLVLTGTGTFTNKYLIDEAGTNTLELENGVTLNNASKAVFNFTNDGNISQSGGGTFINAGLLEKMGGSSTSTISSSFINSGGISVYSSALVLASAGGTSTGGTIYLPYYGDTLDLTGGQSVSYKGTYNVSGNGTVALKSGTLKVASGGATFNLQGTLATHPIFNWTGGTIDVSNGSFTSNGTKNGTLDYSGSSNVVVNGAGSLINNGSIIQTSTGTLTLQNGATLDNAAGATYNIASNGGISQSSGTLVNAGTLEKTAGTGTSTITANTLNNTGTIAVTHGTLDIAATVSQVSGSTLTAGSWSVTGNGNSFPPQPTTLDITTAGNLTTIGTAASVTLNGPNSSGPSAVFSNITGLSTIDAGGGFNLLGGQSFTTKGNLTNNGSLFLGSTNSFQTNTLTVSGTLVNAGTLEKTQGTSTTTVAASTLNNTGTVAVASGALDISATVAQVSGSTLTGGTWSVIGSTSSHPTPPPSTLDISSAGTLTEIGTAANVTLNGLNTTFTNISGLDTIDAGGSLSLLGNQSFTTAGALTNNGSLTLGPNSVLTVSGSYTQSSSGALAIQLGGSTSYPTFGQLVSTNSLVTLAGNLDVTSTVVPRVGTSFDVLVNQGSFPINGTFANLPEGATFTVKVGNTTMTFQITYRGGGFGGNDVVIKRIS